MDKRGKKLGQWDSLREDKHKAKGRYGARRQQQGGRQKGDEGMAEGAVISLL